MGFLFEEFFGWLFDLLFKAIFESERAVGMVAGGLGGLTIMGVGFLLEYFSGYKETFLGEIASVMYCIFPGTILFGVFVGRFVDWLLSLMYDPRRPVMIFVVAYLAGVVPWAILFLPDLIYQGGLHFLGDG